MRAYTTSLNAAATQRFLGPLSTAPKDSLPNKCRSLKSTNRVMPIDLLIRSSNLKAHQQSQAGALNATASASPIRTAQSALALLAILVTPVQLRSQDSQERVGSVTWDQITLR